MQITKSLICFALFALFASCYLSQVVEGAKPMTTPANDPEIINRVNSNPRGRWRAKAYKKFEGKTIGDLKKMLGLVIDNSMLEFYLKGPPKGLVEKSLKTVYGKKVSNSGNKKNSSKKKSSSSSSTRGKKGNKKGSSTSSSSRKKSSNNKKSVSSNSRTTSSSRRRSTSTSNSRSTTTKKSSSSSNTVKKNGKRKNLGGAQTLDTTTSSSTSTTTDNKAATPAANTASDIPTSFDVREKWPNCILPIRNQQQCGSCWAFTATGVLAHRLCVASGGKILQHFSPDFMVRCSTENLKCQGGYVTKAWKFIEDTGVPTEKCVKYTLGAVTDNAQVGGCPTSCDDGSVPQFQKSVAGTFNRYLPAEEQIKRSIMTEGAVPGQLMIYRDFFAYAGGIYSQNSDTQVGGHAIQIVGWGVDKDSGKEYWTCLNSWGETWGEKGYFRIAKGQVGIGNFVFGPQVAAPQ